MKKGYILHPKNRQKKNEHNTKPVPETTNPFVHHPPKSSNAILSFGTPKSSNNLITAAFIMGGPQK